MSWINVYKKKCGCSKLGITCSIFWYECMSIIYKNVDVADIIEEDFNADTVK